MMIYFQRKLRALRTANAEGGWGKSRSSGGGENKSSGDLHGGNGEEEI